jgi:hypothetical protein
MRSAALLSVLFLLGCQEERPRFGYTPPATYNAPLSIASNAISIAPATDAGAGSMSAADKAKLDGLSSSPGFQGYDFEAMAHGHVTINSGAFNIGIQFFSSGAKTCVTTGAKARVSSASAHTIHIELWTAASTSSPIDTQTLTTSGAGEQTLTATWTSPTTMTASTLYTASVYDTTSSVDYVMHTNLTTLVGPNYYQQMSYGPPLAGGSGWYFYDFYYGSGDVYPGTVFTLQYLPTITPIVTCS